MKTASLFSLLALSAYAFIPAYCNPTPNCDVGQACTNNVARDGSVTLDGEVDITQSANETIEYIKAHATAIGNVPGCFWSGYTLVNQMKVYTRSKRDEFKNMVQCTILNDIIETINKTEESNLWPVVPDWTEVSVAFASVLKRQAYVLLGKVVEPDAVWHSEEKKLKETKVPLDRYELNDQGIIVKE